MYLADTTIKAALEVLSIRTNLDFAVCLHRKCVSGVTLKTLRNHACVIARQALANHLLAAIAFKSRKLAEGDVEDRRR